MAKIDFNIELDFVDGDDNLFKEQLIGLLRQADSAENVMESVVIGDLIGDIARSDNPIEVSENDLDVLEDNFNRIMGNDNSQIPNWLSGTLGKLIKEGREQLESDK